MNYYAMQRRAKLHEAATTHTQAQAHSRHISRGFSREYVTTERRMFRQLRRAYSGKPEVLARLRTMHVLGQLFSADTK